jgi:hypothetical protein
VGSSGGWPIVDEGLEDLVERRALTALWELDYVGNPATPKTICDVLGGYYSPKRIEAAALSATNSPIESPKGTGLQNR